MSDTHVHPSVQVGYPAGSSPDQPAIRTVAICAGAGASSFAGKTADLYFTGEMAHHEVLAAVARGTNVILCKEAPLFGWIPRLTATIRQQADTQTPSAAIYPHSLKSCASRCRTLRAKRRTRNTRRSCAHSKWWSAPRIDIRCKLSEWDGTFADSSSQVVLLFYSALTLTERVEQINRDPAHHMYYK